MVKNDILTKKEKAKENEKKQQKTQGHLKNVWVEKSPTSNARR